MKELKNYKIKCEILSPIHIGDGTEIEPLEYVIEDTFYKINLNESLCSLSDDLLKQLKELQTKNDLTGIRRFIKENVDLKNFTEWQTDVSDSVKNIYNEKFDQPENQLMMSPFIRSRNKPYIPASSIKGAIRTAILNFWSDNFSNPKQFRDGKLIEFGILDAIREPRRPNDRFQPDIEKDPFRALKIRDIFLPENSTIFSKVSNFNIDKNGKLNETNIQIIAEVTKSFLFGDPKEFELEISIDRKLFDNPETKLQHRKIDINLLLSACNNFYSTVLENERKRLFDNRDKNIAGFYGMIKEKAKDGYLLRMGWGSGFESMTLEKFRQPKNPQKGRGGWGYSKHLVEGEYPLGWAKLTLGEGNG